MTFNWTKEACEILSTEWLAGKKAVFIGDRLGINRNAVIGKARRLGLPIHTGAMQRRGRQKTAEYWSPSPKIASHKPKTDFHSLNITFADLTETQCRFAVTSEAPHLFCGHEKAEGSSYCLHHHKICWVPSRWRA